MYNLQFTGLRPALSVKAHGDKKKIYDHLKLAFHAGYSSGSSAASAPPGQQPGQSTQPAARLTTTTARTGNPTPTRAAGTAGAAGGPVAAAGASTPTATAPVTGAGAVSSPGGGNPAAPNPGAANLGGGATPNPNPPSGSNPNPNPPAGSNPQPGAPNSAPQTGSTQVAIAADIGYEVEKMVEDTTITIEIVKQASDQSTDASQTQALDLVKQLITQEFFTPAMTNVAGSAASAASQFT